MMTFYEKYMIISGKNINIRTVELSDAKFIFNIRQSSYKTKYLSQVKGTLENQIQWIKEYKIKENNKEEYYFIIESKITQQLGLVRVYDLRENSFCWGSWIIKEDAPTYTAIESALCIYEFAFYTLGFNNSHFDVRKGNTKVINFHKRFGAKIVNEDEMNYYFEYKKEKYEEIKQKYKRYL